MVIRELKLVFRPKAWSTNLYLTKDIVGAGAGGANGSTVGLNCLSVCFQTHRPNALTSAGDNTFTCSVFCDG